MHGAVAPTRYLVKGSELEATDREADVDVRNAKRQDTSGCPPMRLEPRDLCAQSLEREG